jgi:hypothetical protein
MRSTLSSRSDRSTTAVSAACSFARFGIKRGGAEWLSRLGFSGGAVCPFAFFAGARRQGGSKRRSKSVMGRKMCGSVQLSVQVPRGRPKRPASVAGAHCLPAPATRTRRPFTVPSNDGYGV